MIPPATSFPNGPANGMMVADDPCEVTGTLPVLPQIGGLLKDEKKRKSLLFILDGALINASLVLTSGIFLSGYLVWLGGSDFLVGLLNNSLTWASIVALFSFVLYERMARRKRFLLILLAVSRLLVCSVVFLPLAFGKGPATLAALTVMVIAGNILWGIYGIGYSVWMIDSFSNDERKVFIYKRVFVLRIVFTFFTVLMGFVLDWTGKSYLGFLIVFLTGLLLGVVDILVMCQVKEPVKTVDKTRKFRFAMLAEPLASRKYVRFLLFMFLYTTALTVSASFTPLYLIRYLGVDYKVLSAINMIAYLGLILCTRLWSRIDIRMGLPFVFKVSALIAVLEFLIYGFVQGETTLLLYLAPVFSGIGNSGFNIAVFNRRCELMPENDRTVYEGWFAAVMGLSMLAGPVIGDFVMNRLPVVSNAVFQHSRFQFMYLISFVLAGAAVLLLFRRPATDSGGEK